jgi:hypothetical protein
LKKKQQNHQQQQQLEDQKGQLPHLHPDFQYPERDLPTIKQEEGLQSNFRFQQLLPVSPLQQQQQQQQQRETLIFSDIYERQPQATTSYTYDLY